eukprot:m.268055 g.268055  ORF g.268055 m.268055 type:complete len:800 (+) comp35385_c0_seq1:44-2443(+)
MSEAMANRKRPRRSWVFQHVRVTQEADKEAGLDLLCQCLYCDHVWNISRCQTTLVAHHLQRKHGKEDPNKRRLVIDGGSFVTSEAPTSTGVMIPQTGQQQYQDGMLSTVWANNFIPLQSGDQQIMSNFAQPQQGMSFMPSYAQPPQPMFMAAAAAAKPASRKAGASVKADDALVQFLAENNLPFSLTENVSFQQLCTALDPDFVMPNRAKFTASTTAMATAIRQQISTLFNSAKATSLAVEMSSRHVPCAAIHYQAVVDENGKLVFKSGVLGALVFSGDPSEDNFAQFLHRAITSHGAYSSFDFCTIDSVRNAQETFKKSLRQLYSAPDILQSVVTTAFEYTQVLDQLITNINTLVSFFRQRQHQHAGKVLRECHATKPMKFRPRPNLRWNALYMLLERVVDMEDVLVMACSNLEQQNVIVPGKLSVEDWERAKNLVEVLKPFAASAKALSSDGISLSLVVPEVTLLTRACQATTTDSPFVQELKNKLRLALDHQRFNLANPKGPQARATLLDPRFKTMPMFTEQEKSDVEQAVLEFISESDAAVPVTVSSSTNATSTGTTSLSGLVPVPGSTGSLQSEQAYDMLYEAPPDAGAGSVQDELRAYLADPPLHSRATSQQALAYWQASERKFPRVFKAAVRHLSAPASEVSHDRISGFYSFEPRTMASQDRNVMADLMYVQGNTPTLRAHRLAQHRQQEQDAGTGDDPVTEALDIIASLSARYADERAQFEHCKRAPPDTPQTLKVCACEDQGFALPQVICDDCKVSCHHPFEKKQCSVPKGQPTKFVCMACYVNKLRQEE